MCGVCRGYWYDAIDPRTGCALHGTAGASYDEVIGAQVLLGYHKQQQGSDGYNLISHPVAGTQVRLRVWWRPEHRLTECVGVAAVMWVQDLSGCTGTPHGHSSASLWTDGSCYLLLLAYNWQSYGKNTSSRWRIGHSSPTS